MRLKFIGLFFIILLGYAVVLLTLHFVPAAKFARREGIEFILDPMLKAIRDDLLEHIDGLKTTLPHKKAEV